MSQQHFETFDLTIENDIAHICLNRPEKRNSMIPSFWEDLPTAVRDIDDNAKARVIVISASGPVFTAGMDLNAFTHKDHSSADEAKRARIRHGAAFYDTARKTQEAFNALEACRVPVLAAIQGGCGGGGWRRHGDRVVSGRSARYKHHKNPARLIHVQDKQQQQQEE